MEAKFGFHNRLFPRCRTPSAAERVLVNQRMRDVF